MSTKKETASPQGTSKGSLRKEFLIMESMNDEGLSLSEKVEQLQEKSVEVGSFFTRFIYCKIE
jgi:hypothetical protein